MNPFGWRQRLFTRLEGLWRRAASASIKVKAAVLTLCTVVPLAEGAFPAETGERETSAVGYTLFVGGKAVDYLVDYVWDWRFLLVVAAVGFLAWKYQSAKDRCLFLERALHRKNKIDRNLHEAIEKTPADSNTHLIVGKLGPDALTYFSVTDKGALDYFESHMRKYEHLIWLSVSEIGIILHKLKTAGDRNDYLTANFKRHLDMRQKGRGGGSIFDDITFVDVVVESSDSLEILEKKARYKLLNGPHIDLT